MRNVNAVKIIFLLLLTGTLVNGQINTEKFQQDKDEDAFELKWGFSLALHKGNTDLFRMDTDLNIKYSKRENYIFLVGNLTYGEKQKESYVNKGFVHLRGIHKFSKRFMVELFAQEEFNKFILLKRRSLLGGGFRFLLFKYERGDSGLAVNTGIGFMWEKERFNRSGETVKKDDTSLFKSTNYISVDYVINKMVKAGTQTYLQFNTGHLKSTRIYSDFSLEVKLSKALSYIATVNYRFDNNPPASIKKYDIQIKNGITLLL